MHVQGNFFSVVWILMTSAIIIIIPQVCGFAYTVDLDSDNYHFLLSVQI